MDVLNAGVGEVHFAAEQNPDLHVNAFVIEAIPERVIAKVKIGQGGDDGGTAKKGTDDVTFPEGRIGPFESEDFLLESFVVHMSGVAGECARSEADAKLYPVKELVRSRGR